MRIARLHGIALTALLAPLVACAAGSEATLIDTGTIVAQSAADDAGTGATSEDAGSFSSPNGPTKSDDAGSTSTSSEDAGPPASSANDAGAPPASEDSGSTSVPPSEDSGSASSSCPGYAPPSTPSQCDCNPTEHSCTANGCYNGYYCELSGYKCEAPPSGC